MLVERLTNVEQRLERMQEEKAAAVDAAVQAARDRWALEKQRGQMAHSGGHNFKEPLMEVR